MIYGLIIATSVTATILCVTIHRRHLMVKSSFCHNCHFCNNLSTFNVLNDILTLQVWGLFAPKFVFDVAGLILTDGLVCLASLYYFSRVEDHVLHDPLK